MAKLGTYSYPEIRFGDAVEIAARILAKLFGSTTVKALALELGMAENSGTLFAKIAALRAFGLIEGRGEMRVSDLAREIINPETPEKLKHATIRAFERVELFRELREKLNDEMPEDGRLLEVLGEITRAPSKEVIRRSTLIGKHFQDMVKTLHRMAGQGAMVSLPATVTLVIQEGGARITIELPMTDANLNRIGSLVARAQHGHGNTVLGLLAEPTLAGKE